MSKLFKGIKKEHPFVDIPGSGGYSISDAGLIRNADGQGVVPVLNVFGKPIVRINGEERLVEDLMNATFPSAEAAATDAGGAEPTVPDGGAETNPDDKPAARRPGR